jgi:hypothetical protein
MVSSRLAEGVDIQTEGEVVEGAAEGLVEEELFESVWPAELGGTG